MKARKKIKNVRGLLTSGARCWRKVVENYATMDTLSGLQKAHRKTTCDMQTENITKLQSGIDDCLKCLLEILTEEEGTDSDGQQALDVWMASLLEEKEDSFEKASNTILDLICLAGPMIPREGQRSTETV